MIPVLLLQVHHSGLSWTSGTPSSRLAPDLSFYSLVKWKTYLDSLCSSSSVSMLLSPSVKICGSLLVDNNHDEFALQWWSYSAWKTVLCVDPHADVRRLISISWEEIEEAVLYGKRVTPSAPFEDARKYTVQAARYGSRRKCVYIIWLDCREQVIYVWTWLKRVNM